MTGTEEEVSSSITSEAFLQAENFKAQGNEYLKNKEYLHAIESYTNAIDLNPDNAIYYSNRSAAFLSLGDARSKALRDAEKCIELHPKWWKGYSRKGAAEHALGRFDDARATYLKGLQFDPENASGLAKAAEEVYKAGQEHYERQRKLSQQQESTNSVPVQEIASSDTASSVKEDPENELLTEFMSEVGKLEQEKGRKKKLMSNIDFGTSEGQLVRLLQPHFQWINLNPYRVLMLEPEATEDDIKQHYRKISTLVHPDKCFHPQAREAFEEVKKAYNVLLNTDRRKTFSQLILNTRTQVEKEKRQKLKKGVSDLEPLDQAIEKGVLKAFADMEKRRLNIQKREVAQRRREAFQNEKEELKLTEGFKREKSWAQEDRRENRVGNWRDFQKVNKRRKEGDLHVRKGETRGDDTQIGVADNEAYKKAWR
uniref:Hsp70-Hsp90 organising protein n=1 Tax=Albugo laibachii Nc14 TaxID=890382 RepID=F0WVY5_9STRA|nr:Heat shock protein 40 like protein putative [Albugo laibachii Nc14]|eukprot:CCA25587.1 Heat shock protein 40 like protein putative [Albugo laibachii Nc14]